MKRVCLFCGGNLGARPAYAEAAQAFGAALGRRGLGLVYGGADAGLMGAAADAALAAGAPVHGVLPRFMAPREIAHRKLTELVWVESMNERKERMASLSDAFVALPGGYGTMDELFEMLTWVQIGQILPGSAVAQRGKPVGLLDVEGFYTPLVAFLDHATREGLIRPEHRAALIVESDVDRLLDRLAQ
jgi:hypothetical protein